MNDVGRRLVIVGASARAAAMSAMRSGFKPWAIDRFADLDSRAIATTIQVDRYPAGLEAALEQAPPGPWMYTGALENWPELIDRISERRPLYGIGGESLRAVRDPFRLSRVLACAGFNMPRCQRSSPGLPRDGSWLCKPLASAGGSHIRPLAVDSSGDSLSSPVYYQQRVEGLPVGAVFVAAAGQTTLLGVTRQLHGLDWCGLPSADSHRFRYCGSIGPLTLGFAVRQQFERLGNVLSHAFDLRGLFGVDCIVAGDLGSEIDGANEFWPLEVNPRYTASVEILERALRFPSIALHVDAFGDETIESRMFEKTPVSTQPCCGKAILFADRDIIVPKDFPERCAAWNRSGDWPNVADIPPAGTEIWVGQPIVTIFAGGACDDQVLVGLRKLANEIRSNV